MLKNTMLHAITDQGNAIASKFLIYVGVSGSSVGVASKVAEMTNNVPDSMLTIADWGGIAGIVGGTCLAIKSCADVFFNYQKNKRENELHKYKVAKNDDCN